MFLILIVIIQIILLANLNAIESQILQCESITNDLFILNCTIDTRLISISQSSSNSDGGGGGSSTTGLKIGFDKYWKTPWSDEDNDNANSNALLNSNLYQKIQLQSCQLSELGEFTFKNLNNLKRVDLSHNRLIHIDPNTFNLLNSDLIELDMSANLFDVFPTQLFLKSKNLKNLETLKYNANKIGHLKAGYFDGLRNLKHLELNNCNIQQIEGSFNGNLGKLEYLSLVGNHLVHLSEHTFKDLHQLRYLYVHDNLLNCDCKLRWLIGFLKSLEMYTTVQYELNLLKCDQPNSLRTNKLNFIDINPDSFMCDVIINNLTSIEDDQETVRLICDVYADPEPFIYWSFGNKRIEKALNEIEKYFVTEKYLNTKTHKISELKISNLQSSDLGTYNCTGEVGGLKKSQSIRLTNSDSFLARSVTSILTSPRSNWTIILLIAITISICIFTLSIILFVCWKCKKLKSKNNTSLTSASGNNNKLLLDDLNFHYSLRDDVTPKYALTAMNGANTNEYVTQQHQHLQHPQTTASDSYLYDDILQMSLCGGGINGTGLGIDSSDAHLLPKQTQQQYREQMYATIRPKYVQLAHSTMNPHTYDHMYSIAIPLRNSAQQQQHYEIQQDDHNTSLDEEDINDLKDFEDVTFDNLNKPAK